MDIAHFSHEIRAEFGPKMEHATPANIHAFLERMHGELSAHHSPEQPFDLPRENAANYEQVVTAFLARVLTLPPEEGVILLWVFASELFYARLGEQYDQQLSDLLTFDLNG